MYIRFSSFTHIKIHVLQQNTGTYSTGNVTVFGTLQSCSESYAFRYLIALQIVITKNYQHNKELQAYVLTEGSFTTTCK